MVDRVPNARSTSTHSPTSSGTAGSKSPPPSLSSFSDEATEFASLLARDTRPNPSDQNSASDSSSTDRTDGTTESTTSPQDQDRVTEKKDDRGDSENGQDGNGQDSQEPTPLPTLGDVILQAFSKGDATQISAAPPTGPNNIDAIVQQVADRILISDPSGGSREVRITLKEGVLPGTEIRISQEGGKLQVRFVTDSLKSQELLQQNHSALQDRLSERLSKHEVLVQVDFDGQFSGGENDGRSRQQRNIAEEQERTEH